MSATHPEYKFVAVWGCQLTTTADGQVGEVMVIGDVEDSTQIATTAG